MTRHSQKPDKLLSHRQAEVEALLEEAQQAKQRGEVEPSEPLRDFLRRAHARKAGLASRPSPL